MPRKQWHILHWPASGLYSKRDLFLPYLIIYYSIKMKNDANIRNFIEISGNLHGKSGNLHGKSGKMQGKSGNFRGIHSSRWQNRREIVRSFPVVSGRFRSFPVVFARNSLVIPVNSGHSRSFSDWFRLIPENHSFSFLFIPFRSSFLPKTTENSPKS